MPDTPINLEGKNNPIPVFPYKIVYGDDDTDSPFQPENPSFQMAVLQNELIHESINPSKRTVERIQNAINRYPDQPQFYNFLSTAYTALGKNTKAEEVFKKTYAKFPDYLFARLGMGQYELKKGNTDKVVELLGKSLKLEDLYPDRKIFHSSEVLSYYQMVAIYHADKGQFDEAQDTLSLMKYVDEHSRQVEATKNYIFSKMMEKAQDTILDMFGDEITLPDRMFHYENQVETPPDFHHPEIQWLYENDCRIPIEKINTILALPRKTLIEDLEAVLEDGIRRFEYYNDLEWEFKTHSFLAHAIILLGELKAYESLPAILNQMRLGDEYNEFWFGDWATEIFLSPLYHLGRNQIGLLKDFVLEPHIEAQYKDYVSKPISFMVVLEPERREEFIAWYEEVIRYLMDHEDQEDLLDTAFIAYLISYLLDVKMKELMPLVKEVYDRGLASLGVLGEWKDVEADFEEGKDKEVLYGYFENAFDQYSHIAELLDEADKRDQEAAERFAKNEREAAERLAKKEQLQRFESSMRQSYASYEPVKVEKIGRNDRVSVKYADGTVKNDVKYKTVEQDVESGKATLIR